MRVEHYGWGRLRISDLGSRARLLAIVYVVVSYVGISILIVLQTASTRGKAILLTLFNAYIAVGVVRGRMRRRHRNSMIAIQSAETGEQQSTDPHET